MNEDLSLPVMWLLRTVLGGGLLLLFVWALARCTRQPARRQRLAEIGIAAALILAVLAVLPGWLPLPYVTALPTTPVSITQPGLQNECDAAAFDERCAAAEAVQAEQGDDKQSPMFYVPLPPDTYLAGFNGPNHHVPRPIEDPRAALELPDTDDANAEAATWSIPWNAVFPYLFSLYFVGAALVAAGWLLGHVSVRQLRRHAVSPPRNVCRLFAAMTKRMRHPPRVLVSRALRVPVSFGVWRPTIVLPARLCRRAEKSRLRWVFAHELTHLKRGDAWSCLLVSLGGVVYYFCPWFWGLRRHVRLCQEYVADAVAVSHDARHEDYAQFLLGLASVPAGPALAMSVRGTSSDLFRRVTMLLQNPIRVERRCARLWWVGTAMSLLGVAVFVSGIGAAPDKPVLPEKVIIADDDQDEPSKDEEKPTKNEKKKEKVKKKSDRNVFTPDDFPFEEMRKALENLPDRVDAERIEKEVRKALEQAKARHNEWRINGEEVRQRAMEALEKIDKNVVREHALEALKGLKFDDEQLKNQVKDALDNVHLWVSDEDVKNLPKGFQVFGADGKLFPTAAGQGRLGVMVDQPSAALREHLDLEKGRGLVITQVTADSAAAKAGLKVNDILMEMNGKRVSDKQEDLQKLVEGLEANSKVDALVLRKGKKEKITGIQVSEATNRIRAGAGGAPPAGGMAGFGKGGGFGQAGGMAFGGGGPGMVMTTVNRTNERVNARHQEGNLVITLTGTVADGKAKMSEIHIQDGGKANKHESIQDVPDRYRDKVKGLVDMCEKGNVKIDVKTPRRERPSRNRDDSDPDNIR